MAYADFEFYTISYRGNVVPESEFDRIADRASDFLDIITFDRLVEKLPDNERAKTKIQKAVCALCDKIYQKDLADQKAMGAVSGETISSRSAGSESISYVSPTEIANVAKTLSGDDMDKTLYDTAKAYLTGAKDDEGIPLLYAGVRHV